MDDFEQRVIRRKRGIIVKTVEVNSDMLDYLRKHEVITVDTAQNIAAEHIRSTRITHLLDGLTYSDCTEAFDKFGEALEAKYPSLRKEIEKELQVEKGSLRIDPGVRREASIVVHRKFGCSKRFSEMEKKEIEDLVAIKIQLGKEDWKDRVEQLQEDLKLGKDHSRRIDQQIGIIGKILDVYNTEHAPILNSPSSDMTSTAEVLLDAADDEDGIAILIVKLRRSFNLTHFALAELESLRNERSKCLRLLDAASDNEVSLDGAIRRALDELPKRGAEETLRQLKVEREQAAEMIERIRQLEKELHSNQESVMNLTRQLEIKDSRMNVLQHRVGELVLGGSQLTLFQRGSNGSSSSSEKSGQGSLEVNATSQKKTKTVTIASNSTNGRRGSITKAK